mgnify:CR=1 FL=1
MLMLPTGVVAAILGQRCSGGLKCLGNAECRSGRCRCPLGTAAAPKTYVCHQEKISAENLPPLHSEEGDPNPFPGIDLSSRLPTVHSSRPPAPQPPRVRLPQLPVQEAPAEHRHAQHEAPSPHAGNAASLANTDPGNPCSC